MIGPKCGLTTTDFYERPICAK